MLRRGVRMQLVRTRMNYASESGETQLHLVCTKGKGQERLQGAFCSQSPWEWIFK